MDRYEARERIGANPDHKIILFVGRIEPLKGLDVLMFALKIIVEKCHEKCPCLWIVGEEKEMQTNTNKIQDKEAKRENPELQKLYQLQHQLNLQNCIKFVGQKSQKDLVDYYNAADVVVMPSHYESFGMSALEAMACGTPVITTNVAGISSIFEESGNHLVISAHNPLELARAIEKIIGAKNEVGNVKHTQIENFTWEKMAKRMEGVYDRLTQIYEQIAVDS